MHYANNAFKIKTDTFLLRDRIGIQEDSSRFREGKCKVFVSIIKSVRHTTSVYIVSCSQKVEAKV